jgi:hypothetical protein
MESNAVLTMLLDATHSLMQRYPDGPTNMTKSEIAAFPVITDEITDSGEWNNLDEEFISLVAVGFIDTCDVVDVEVAIFRNDANSDNVALLVHFVPTA